MNDSDEIEKILSVLEFIDIKHLYNELSIKTVHEQIRDIHRSFVTKVVE